MGGGLGEGGGRGGAGEGVAGDESIMLSHRWRRLGEDHFYLSNTCLKHLWRAPDGAVDAGNSDARGQHCHRNTICTMNLHSRVP